jgi:predicted alpha-1,2-mannosidase
VALTACAIGAPPATAADLAGHVDTFAGTQPGSAAFGGGRNFPGAALPFGMVQWSPDTTPSKPNSAAYDHRDDHLSGFSLTHLSGAGCGLYGDFPFLPTTEPLSASPAKPGSSELLGNFQPGLSHSSETASPGFYSTRLNPVGGGAIGVDLTATTRTGMGRFTFPTNPESSILINAGGSAEPDDFAAVSIDPAAREVSGAASSGHFCAQRPRYKVYFAAVFNRPFQSYGTWRRGTLNPAGVAAEDSQGPVADPRSTAQAGAYVGFDTGGDPVVTVRVGISFVSVAGARANLAAESGNASFATIASRARRRWDQALGRIRVSGGSPTQIDTFYTALYHAFLAPRTFNDVDGAYPGMDGLVHQVHGRTQYADFSGWDIYRSEVQLLAMLAPKRADDMMRSLLADAAQSGCLPRWSYANAQSMTMVGDSADPILASAAAFGATGFDGAAALAAMVRGATEPCHSANGEYVERQGLAEYQALGYVPFDSDTRVANADSISGSPEAVWASASTSLEYAIDDFAIAQFAARSQHDRGAYRTFIRRSANWRKLYDPAGGLVEPRYASGAFPDPYGSLSGQGFAEGDSPQYTWMVPQDPAGLARAMGGAAKAAARLHHFLRVLNGGQAAARSDHALLGNEPTLQTPWLYDWMGRPFLTQEAVRRALTLYRPAPDGYPGNDDLGTLSAWYVFGALGLYPEVPGVGVLAISGPLFRQAEIRLPHRKRVRIATAGRGLYVQSLRFDGGSYDRPWTTYCSLARGADLNFKMGRRPNRRWGAGAAAAPPSFGPRHRMPKSSCAP